MEGGREQNYWPGFVDALSNVVLTLVFVLVVFVFALMMASNKVEKKMQEVVAADKAQKAEQAQLNQALSELQQLRSQDAPSDAKNSPTTAQAQQQEACLRFSKSDATQKAEVSGDGLSILVTFGENAITITEDTAKAIHDFLAAAEAKTGNDHPKLAIEASDDPTSSSPLLARETQLGRILNARNSLLKEKVEPGNITVHSVPSLAEKNSYNWVMIHVAN